MESKEQKQTHIALQIAHTALQIGRLGSYSVILRSYNLEQVFSLFLGLI